MILNWYEMAVKRAKLFFDCSVISSEWCKARVGVSMFINNLYKLWIQWERKRSGDKRQEQPIRERLATRLRTALFDTFGPWSIQTGSTRPTFFRCVPADIRDRWRHNSMGLFPIKKRFRPRIFLLKKQTGGSSANLMRCQDYWERYEMVLHVRRKFQECHLIRTADHCKTALTTTNTKCTSWLRSSAGTG